MSKMVTTSDLKSLGYSTAVTDTKCPTVSEFETQFTKNSFRQSVPDYAGSQLFPEEAIVETRTSWFSAKFTRGGNSSAFGNGVGFKFFFSTNSSYSDSVVDGTITLSQDADTFTYALGDPKTYTLYLRCYQLGTSNYMDWSSALTITENCVVNVVIVGTSPTTFYLGAVQISR